MAVSLTPLSKGLITIAVLGAVGAAVYKNKDKLAELAPGAADKPVSNVPPEAKLPDDPGPAVTDSPPGCADKPEVRFYHWAWNAQAGMILATGGKQAVEGSLMCKHGVNLKLIREDNTDQMQALLATFAEGLKKGEANPAAGAHFVGIMGDGSATFLKARNDRLRKLGPGLTGVVVGSAGYSRGKRSAPSAWSRTALAARRAPAGASWPACCATATGTSPSSGSATTRSPTTPTRRATTRTPSTGWRPPTTSTRPRST